jgi:hypothetical protein
MRRLLLRLSFFAPFVAVMAAVNWTVDPAQLFGRGSLSPLEGYEGVILDDLLAGRPHKIAAEYNQPAVLEELIRARKQIDVLVLGTSVTTPLHSENFPGQVLLNGSIPGGDLEESVCVYEIALECGRRPKRVLLEVRGWGYMLGKRNSVLIRNFGPILTRAMTWLSEADSDGDSTQEAAPHFRPREMTSGLTAAAGWVDPYDKLISPRYFQFALRMLALRYLRRDLPAGQGLPEERQTLLYPDGSIQWPKAMQDVTAAANRQRFRPVTKPIAEFEQAARNEERCRLFEAFILRAQRSGTEVDILLTPPMAWLNERVEADYRQIGRQTPASETERYIRAFAHAHHVRIFGSFDQKQTELTEADYVDGAHIRRESIGKLLRDEEQALHPRPPR